MAVTVVTAADFLIYTRMKTIFKFIDKGVRAFEDFFSGEKGDKRFVIAAVAVTLAAAAACYVSHLIWD